MNAKGAGKGAVVGLLAVIVIAGYFIFRQAGGPGQRVANVDWACEECDHLFQAPAYFGTRDCPRCPGEAVRTYIYHDSATGDLFELYRQKPGPDADPEDIGPETMLIKVPGGEWEAYNFQVDVEYGFPVRFERPEDLRYAPPGSKLRN